MLCQVQLVHWVTWCPCGDIHAWCTTYIVCQVQCAGGACVSLSYSNFRVGGGNMSRMTGSVAPLKLATEVAVTAVFGRVFQIRIVLGNMLYI